MTQHSRAKSSGRADITAATAAAGHTQLALARFLIFGRVLFTVSLDFTEYVNFGFVHNKNNSNSIGNANSFVHFSPFQFSVLFRCCRSALVANAALYCAQR